MEKFKSGDRIVYVGLSPEYADKKDIGKTGVFHYRESCNAFITLDGENHNRSVFLENIDFEKKIDVTKPLCLEESKREVTFITMTDDGNIVAEFLGHWAIFDSTGRFLRGSINYSIQLSLINKPVKTCEYIALNLNGELITGTPGYRERKLAWEQNPEAGHLIQIDMVDGVVEGVGVLKRPD